MAEKLGLSYIETSAKDPPLNVDLAFHEVSTNIKFTPWGFPQTCVVCSDAFIHMVKTMKNTGKLSKSTFVIMHMRGSCKAHVEKQRKSLLVSN